MPIPHHDESKSAELLSRVSWLLRFSIGIGIVAFLVSRHDFSDLRRTLGTTSWPILLGAVVFYWLGQLLCAWKWKLLLAAQNANVSFANCCRLYAVGMFWNLWMPTNIGGDAVRALRCGALCGSRTVAASSILVERITGLTALIVIGSLAFVIQIIAFPIAFPIAWPNATRLLTATLVFFVLVLALFGITRKSTRRNPTRNATRDASRFSQKVAALREASLFYLAPQQRSTLFTALLLSMIFQASQIVLNVVLARALGLTIPPLVFWWLVPALSLASLLPLGIGGLGVREVAAVQFLGVFNVSAPTIIAWSLLWQATVWLASLVGAVWTPQSSTRSVTKKQR